MLHVVFKFLSFLPSPIKAMLYRLQYCLFRMFGRPRKSLESAKARERRRREGFFDLFCIGKGLDIGYGGDLLTPTCTGWDIEHGDAQLVEGIKDESYDFVYSSHTLEHMVDPVVALRNWWRVVKSPGYLILYIPHRDLYEKKENLPSQWNGDHKHFFLLDRDELPDTKGILGLLERSLAGYEVIYAKECSEGHAITEPEVHSDGEYSIEVVIRKTDD